MQNFLESNEGKNITSKIVRYRQWVEPLNAKNKLTPFIQYQKK